LGAFLLFPSTRLGGISKIRGPSGWFFFFFLSPAQVLEFREAITAITATVYPRFSLNANKSTSCYASTYTSCRLILALSIQVRRNIASVLQESYTDSPGDHVQFDDGTNVNPNPDPNVEMDRCDYRVLHDNNAWSSITRVINDDSCVYWYP
jgi:hypothetical protein